MRSDTSGQVFLTDGLWRKTLATLRALCKEGLKVSVGERTYLAPALFSKFAQKRCVYPSVSLSPKAFIDWLEVELSRRRYDVLLTPEEETSILVAKNRSRLANFSAIPLPEYDKLIFAGDKLQVMSLGAEEGIAVPRTSFASNIFELKQALSEIGFPSVMKPRKGTGARGIKYLNCERDLEEISSSVFERFGDFLLQEYIPGTEYYGVSVLFNSDNRMKAAFCHKKLRQYPISGGVSTYAESVHRDDLVSIAEKVLGSIGWFGAANVEFKIDSRDGKPKLMEINPRLWGSIHLAVEAGVNFPFMLYELGLTGDVDSSFSYEDGVRYRWMLQGDIMSFASKLMTKRRIDRGYFNFFEKDLHYGILSLRDPMPAVGKVLSVIDYFTSKEMKRFHV